MEQCNPANTPVTPGTKLVKSTEETETINTELYINQLLGAYSTCLDGPDRILHSHTQLIMLPDSVLVPRRSTGQLLKRGFSNT